MTAPALSPAERTSLWPWGLAGLVVAGLLLVPLAKAWTLAPDLGHGWAAPLLMFYLWWERWAERPPYGAPTTSRAAGGIDWWVIGGLLVVAVPLRLLLTPYPGWPMALTLYVGSLIAAAVWVVGRRFGRAGVIWVGGPLLILPGVMPWPGVVETHLILPIRHGIAWIVAEGANLLGAPALASGTSVRLANGWVGIDEACGGIRSLHASVTTALFFGEWFRFSLRRRLALVAAGALAAMAGNLARVAFLSWCATGPDGRLDRWHDTAGWIALGFSLVLTGLVGWRWSKGATAPAPLARRPAAAALSSSPPVPAMVIAAVVALISLEGATRWWYGHGLKQAANDHAQWTAVLPLDAPTFEPQLLTDRAEEMLRPDRFTAGAWIGVDGVRRMANYVEWYQGQAARHAPFFHNPTICLPASGAELVDSLGTIEITIGDTAIPFESYIFRQLNRELVVAFTIWDPSTGGPLHLPNEHPNWRAWFRDQWGAVAEAKQHQPAQLLAFAMEGRENEARLPSELKSLLIPAEIP